MTKNGSGKKLEEEEQTNIVERVNRISRSLVYLLFIVAVVYLLSLRAEKGKTVVLGEWPLVSLVQGTSGKVILKERSDGSQVLVIKLNRALPQTTIVVGTPEGIFREIGTLKGATFVSTLPRDLPAREIAAIKLISPEERILAEVSIKVK